MARILLPFLLAVELATAAALSNSPRALISAQTIVADVDAINAGVQALRKDLKAYNGGALSETPLIAAFTQIEVANRKGYADAEAASNFTASGSDAIVNAVIDTVGITIPDSITELKAKKPLFQASDQDALIKSTLQILLYDHLSFSHAVEAHLTSDIAQGTAVVEKIAAAIQDGIDDFST